MSKEIDKKIIHLGLPPVITWISRLGQYLEKSQEQVFDLLLIALQLPRLSLKSHPTQLNRVNPVRNLQHFQHLKNFPRIVKEKADLPHKNTSLLTNRFYLPGPVEKDD